MKLFLLGLFLLINTALAQRENTLPGDCLRIGAGGECITQAEFNTLSGATSSVQDQLDGKFGLTGDESVSGVKTFTGKIVASSTTNGFAPCPSMTTAERDAIVAPSVGDCVYNTTLGSLNVYNGSAWKSAGGGVNQWLTGTAYLQDDVVIESNKLYIALNSHTAGTFATDLGNGNWQLLNAKTDVSTDATGILPMANGGTDKALTPVLGGVVYTDGGSMEVLGAGTSGQVLQSNGAAAPTWVTKALAIKAENSSSVNTEELQAPNNQITETAANKHRLETGNKNILTNPSFEHTTASTGWTFNGTTSGSANTTSKIDGLQSITATAVGGEFQMYQDSTINAADIGGKQGVASVWIKTTYAGTIQVCPRVNGSRQNCVDVSNSGEWQEYVIPFVLGTTSSGIEIYTDGDAIVHVDDAKVALEKVVSQSTVVSSWTSYTPTYEGMGTVTGTSFRWRQVGSNIEVNGVLTVGGRSGYASISLPSGFEIDTTALTLGNTTAAPGHSIGRWGQTAQANGDGNIVTATGTSATKVYFSQGPEGGDKLIPYSGSIYPFESTKTSIAFSVPVKGLSSSINTYSQTAQSGSYVPNIEGSSSNPTIGTTTARLASWQKIGSSMLLQWTIIQTGAGTAGSGTYLFPLPPGYTIDSARANISTDQELATVLGYGDFNNTSSKGLPLKVMAYDSTRLFGAYNGGTLLTNAAGVGGANWRMTFTAIVPIAGWSNVITGSFKQMADVAYIKDVKASGTAGGDSASGGYTDRALNTLTDPNGIVTSLSSNQFTLPPGKYEIQVRAPARNATRHKVFLYSVTDTADAIIGETHFMDAYTDMEWAEAADIITLTTAKTFKVRHWTANSSSPYGMGFPASISGVSEVYTTVKIRKLY